MKKTFEIIATYLLIIINKINTIMSHRLLQIITWSNGRLIKLSHIQKGHRHSFKIVLDVLYIQNDLKRLLHSSFTLINQIEIYRNISHKTILITVGDDKGRYFSLNKSILIGPDFNLDIYYEMIRSGIEKVLGYGLDITDIRTIEILVIDQDRVWN